MVNSHLIQIQKRQPKQFFLNLGSQHNEFNSVSKQAMQPVLDELIKESSKESWKALENLILSTSVGKRLTVKFISLHECIKFNSSYEFFRHLILSGCDVNAVEGNMKILGRCLSLQLHKNSALLIVHGAKLEPNNSPPLIYCVLLIIYNHCKRCIYFLLTVLNISSIC